MPENEEVKKDHARGGLPQKWVDFPYKYLVIATEDYIVTLDYDLIVDWAIDSEVDEIKRRGDPKHNFILNEVARLEAVPCAGLNEVARTSYKRLVGEALARSIEGDDVNARLVVALADKYIGERNAEVSRYWYLSASFAAATILVIIGATARICRNTFVLFLGWDFFWLLIAAVSGGMGALLSVITRSGTLNLNSSAGRKLHFLEGGSRILAGSISGLIVGLSVKSGLFLSAISDGPNQISVMLVGATAAGIAERLATSIVSKVDPSSRQEIDSGRNKRGK